MLVSLRKNGLDSLFKEVRVFKDLFRSCRTFLIVSSRLPLIDLLNIWYV